MSKRKPLFLNNFQKWAIKKFAYVLVTAEPCGMYVKVGDRIFYTNEAVENYVDRV